MEPTVPELLLGIALPAVVCGLLLVLLRRAFGGEGARRGARATAGAGARDASAHARAELHAGARSHAGSGVDREARIAAVAVAAGYLAGHVGLRGWRDWAPREAVDWIAVVALLGLLVGAAGLVRRWPQRLRGVLRVIVAAGAVWLVAGKPMERALGEAGMWQQVALLGAGIALAWSALEGLATPAVRAGPLLLLWLLAAGCAAVLAISGSLVLGKLAGALAAALGAAIVLGVRRPGAATLLGAAPPVALTLGALLVAGMRLASVPPRAALALLAAAVSAFAVRLLAGRAARSRGATGDGPGTLVAQLLVAGVLAGTAFSLALAASPPLDEAGY